MQKEPQNHSNGDKIIEAADTWKFWVSAALFGVIVLFILMFFLFKKTVHQDAIREASLKANNAAQVASCFNNVKNAPIIEGFIDAHAAIINNSIISTEAALKVSAPNDPLNVIRRQSLVRLRKARKNSNDLKELLAAQNVTEGDCIKLAKRLNVPSAVYTKPAK